MSWSYSGNPNNSSLDAVRFLIGDTISTDPQLQDEEINYELSEENNVYLAAIACAQALAAKFARLVDKAVDSFRISYSQRQAHYLALANSLTTRAAMKDGTPYVGGLTETDKLIDSQNPNMVQPEFNRKQFDEPLANTPNNVQPDQTFMM